MDEIELGQATIVYDDPEEGTTEVTVDNEEVVYARDHWMLKSGTDDDGNDLMKQIPRDRVHSVERNVERFEDEASTVRNRVESLASEMRERLPVGGDGERRHGDGHENDDGPTRVPVTEADDHESDDGE
ncbi:hypothetical protein C475_00490 [Halosimplex carlsbadense 2-9-1]|uniref:Uncharacterized protein n=1 Tax=Halosimplex carlsbadense 2-9-1 TaxID=797114 RepID=M0D517_9EURY|nr:hypothetical protein [Halosimplex carlsbadense]ELZ30576.1 hypothetical protein C475_00490 [Halosimplex carlsbadense 2-9-1]